MPLIDTARARQFAAAWIDAWNRHDLDAVLAHYAEDCEFSSPLVVELAGVASGTLRGKAAVRAHWEAGLQWTPDLHFELLDVLAGIEQITVYYRGHRGTVIEACHFDASGRVIRATASYALDRATRTLLVRPALDPGEVPRRTTSIYPTEELRRRIAGRSKQALGDALGLQSFGVNLVTLAPGGVSALRHWHTRQDEFVYVLQGTATLITERTEQTLGPGSCAGFPAGQADGHQLINRTALPAIYLEAGDRLPGDQAHYPEHDLLAYSGRGTYAFVRKDGSAY